MPVTIICAMDRNGGIGIDNKLPFRFPEDMKMFRQTTEGHKVVMGRKTFESLPTGPLINRENYVLSNSKQRRVAINHHPLIGINEFFETEGIFNNDDEVFIIGGAELYSLFLGVADKMILTHVDGEFTCDTFFPEFDKNAWTETARTEIKSTDSMSGKEYNLSFVTYEVAL